MRSDYRAQWLYAGSALVTRPSATVSSEPKTRTAQTASFLASLHVRDPLTVDID
jgi:hypothetical protein